MAARRTSNHHSLRGTEGAVFSRELEHRASRKSAAMRFALWQRRYRGSWAPAFVSLAFPADAGTTEPPSAGRRPGAHESTAASAARRAPVFQENSNTVPADN